MVMAVCTRVATPSFSKRILQGERIDDGGEHAHVIAGGAFDAAFAARQTAKDIAAADDHDHFHAQFAHFADLLGHVVDGFRGNADPGLAPQRFAAQFEQNPAILRFVGLFHKINGPLANLAQPF